jgi:hypothetical protein
MVRSQVRNTDNDDVVTLLQGMQWEIRQLLSEMEEILPMPSVRYELYPRLALACRLYQHGKNRIFKNGKPQEDCNLIRGVLYELDQTPWKDDQTQSPRWRASFEELRNAIAECFVIDERVLSRLGTSLSVAERRRLGSLFKEAIQSPPPSLLGLKLVRPLHDRQYY